MVKLLTRHSLEFDLLAGELITDYSPYAESYPNDYVSKRAELGKLVGTNSFIWCIPVDRHFQYYEMCKPVEWTVQVSESRICGYVHDQNWFEYLEGRQSSITHVYYPDTPPSAGYSVLVRYPLKEGELLQMKIFRFRTSDKADILCVKHFQ